MYELHAGPTRLDMAYRRVLQNGVEVPTTATEFNLLAALAEQRGAMTHLEICRALGPHYRQLSTVEAYSTLKVFVRRLRRKLGDDAIETLRGYGYALGEGLREPPAGETGALF